MRTALTSLINEILSLPLIIRRIFFITIDVTLILLSIWFSFWLRLSSLNSPIINSCIWLFPTTTIVGIIIYFFTGHYRGLSKYLNRNLCYKFGFRNLLLIITVFLIALTSNLLFGNNFVLNMPPKSIWIIMWFTITFSNISFRIFVSDIRKAFNSSKLKKIPKVIIYGAGSAGAQLEASLNLIASHKILAFFDDNKHLWYRSLNGIKIYPPSRINDFLEDIDQILMAMPSINYKRKKEIINYLQPYDIPVFQIPNISEITSGKEKINKLKLIQIEDLLGREKVSPSLELMGKNIKNSIVLVTGAGGSIGSELSKQIFSLNPKLLILLDNSEYNLYRVNQIFIDNNFEGINVEFILGDVSDIDLLLKIFDKYKFDIVFHAAAYKHVPIVENNPIAGIKNNVFSTLAICQVAYKMKIKQVILISSDKAVRPENVMGATKRLSEIIIQIYAEKSNQDDINKTCFSMVRFGNVLNSSGSVVPLFKKQIARGGPITLTDERMTRFFMTIDEACELVIQASSLSLNGDVILLDMGLPVSIKSLAEQMIKLHGLALKDKDNPNGDIEIVIAGLREGEKLHEELLIDAKSERTQHPLIFKAKEQFQSSDETLEKINLLKLASKNNDITYIFKILSELVPEWNSSKFVG